MYAFDNSEDKCDEDEGLHLVGNGTLMLSLKFMVPTLHIVTMLGCQERDIISVEQQHNVFMVDRVM